MARIVSTHSFRGGTGKSNLTANLAVLLARHNKRVGIIDTDIQSPGIHTLFALPEQHIVRALNDYLWGKCAIEEATYDVSAVALGERTDLDKARLFLIPSSIKSGEIARILREGYDVARLNDGFQELLRKLHLDYLLIDTHPGVNEETLLSIAISDMLVLVMRPDNQDFQGTAVTLELARRLEVPKILLVINKVPPNINPQALREHVEKMYDARVAGILPMNYEMAEVASSAIFVDRHPEHPFTKAAERLALQLLP